MSDAVKTLLWKEYRENFRVWGAAVVDGLLLLTGAVLAREALSIRGETVFSMGALVVLVYATILSADIFVREKEDGYLPFLNRFPITARQVAAAKFLWIALSTFALAVVFAAVCQGLVLSGLFTAENPIPSFRFFLSRGVVSLNGILWGLFWSTRAARRLSAIILTMLSTVAIPLLAEIFSQTITGAFMASLFLFVECVVCEFLVCPILDGIDNWFNERGRKKAEGESTPLLDKLRPRSALTVLTAQGIFQLRGAAAMLQLTALLPVPLLIAAAALPPSEPKQSLELLTLLVVAGVLFFGIFLTGTFLVRDFQEGNHSFLLRLPPRPLLFWFSRLAGICCVWVLPAALGLGMALTAGNAFGRESHLFSESLLKQFPAFRVWEIANAFVFAAAVPLLGLWTGALCRNRITSISLEIFLLAVLLTSAFVTTPPSMSPLAHLIPLSLFAAGSYDLVRRQLRGTVSIAYRVAHLLLLPAAALTIILVIFPVVRICSVALLPDRFDPDQIARYGWTDRLRAERDYFRQRPLRRACKAEALAAIRANETGNRTAESIPIERVFQRRLEFRERGLDVLTPGWEYFWTSQSLLEPVTDSLWSREEEFFRAIHQSVETAAPEQLRRFIEVLGAIPQIRPSGPRLEEAIDRLYHAQVTASYLYGYLSDEEPREFFIPRINDRRLRWERAAVCRRFLHNKRILDLCAARQAEQTIYAAGPVRSSGVAAGIVSVPAARGEISDEEKARLFETADRCCESVRRVSFRFEWFMRSGDIEACSRRDGYAHFDLEGNRFYLSYDRRLLRGDQLEPYTHRQDLFNGEVCYAEYDPKKKIPKVIETGPMPEKYDDIIALAQMMLDPILFCVMDHREDDSAPPAGRIKKYAIPLGDAVRKMSFREITGENGERLIRGDFKGEWHWFIIDFDPARDYRWVRITTIVTKSVGTGDKPRFTSIAREWTEIDGVCLPTAIEHTLDRGTLNDETLDFVPAEGTPVMVTQIRAWDYKLGDETDDFSLRDIPDGTEVFDRRDQSQSYVWKDGKVVPGKTKKAPPETNRAAPKAG